MKRLNKLMVFLIISIIGIINVKSALPGTLTNVRKIDGTGATHNSYDSLPIKTSDSGAVLCTNFLNANFPSGSCTTITSGENYWNASIRAGVAAIIKKIGTVNTASPTAPENYYYGELAINEFLCTNGIKTGYTCVSSNRTTQQILGSYYSWYEAGVAAKNNYKDASINLSTQTLTFSFDGTNYVSNSITVTKSFDDGYSITSDIGSVIKDGNAFRISVPSSSITSSSTTVNVTVSISKTVDLAQNYACGSGQQTVTPNMVETKTLSDSKTAKGTIQTTSLTIKKVDKDNNRISGVKIKVTGPNNYSEEFTTTSSSDIVIDNLVTGTYTITELETAPGYNKLSESKTVTIGSSNMAPTVTLTNKLTETLISKKSAVDSSELPGATLEILDKNKEKISCTILDKDGNKKELEECSWISTDEPTKVVGLAAGKYFLKETIAPEGYELSKNMVEFEVKADGSVTEVEMVDELEVEVPNTLSARSALLLTIAMIDIALGIGIITYVKKNKIEQ